MANNDLQAKSETIGRKENRQRLARATIEYFDSLSPSEIAEDQSFTESLYHVSDKVNFDEDSEDQPAK
jgi:hypothetical protein